MSKVSEFINSNERRIKSYVDDLADIIQELLVFASPNEPETDIIRPTTVLSDVSELAAIREVLQEALKGYRTYLGDEGGLEAVMEHLRTEYQLKEANGDVTDIPNKEKILEILSHIIGTIQDSWAALEEDRRNVIK